MAEPSIPLILKVLEALWKRFSALLVRPKILAKRAPANLLEHVAPHISLARAREVLGVPIRECDSHLSFCFSDAFVQVHTTDGKSIAAVFVVLPKVSRWSTFQVYPLNFVLGKSTLAEVTLGEEPAYTVDSSSKHFLVSMSQFFGFDGRYLHYVFGVLSSPNVESTELKWFYEAGEGPGVLVSKPSEIVPNLVAVVAGGPDEFQFDHWAFSTSNFR